MASKIHEAAKQLAGVAVPKVLALVNSDLGPDRNDLIEALQGYLEYDDGIRSSSLSPHVEQRLAQDRTKIDLYLWIENGGAEPARITLRAPMTSNGRALLRQLGDVRS